ncbi:hypothetical protein [Winogradskyella sp.]|uniref:hypothetical protein n=1 Tax=Winogradskyella sp. TaxID=1883156 RepID=UPI0025DF550E|nr:hypothetical protein [Winogradskyella sp.]
MPRLVIKQSLFIITLLIIISCVSSQDKLKQDKCQNLYKTHKVILNKTYKTILNKDTIIFNEMRFYCVSPFYTIKGMFNKFGKWDKEIYPNNVKQPLIKWEKIDLFSDGNTYDIVANGNERKQFASIMIFDSQQNDLLSSSSNEKDNLRNYFDKFFKKNRINREDFYKIYWKSISPKGWERIQEYQKRKKQSENK